MATPATNSTNPTGAAANTKSTPLEDLQKLTNFNRVELDVLLHQFRRLGPTIAAGASVEKVDRQRFRDLLGEEFGMTESLLMDRIFRVFDVDADNFLTLEEFVKGMSVFLKGKQEERLKFCFKIYDLNGDRYISKEEMFQMLQHCLAKGSDDDEDGVKDLVDMILKKLDEDRDGRVNEQDYASAVAKDSLLLEAFGQCLPNRKDIHRYLQISHAADSEEEFVTGAVSVKSGGKGGLVAAGKDDARSPPVSVPSNTRATK